MEPQNNGFKANITAASQAGSGSSGVLRLHVISRL
jgi:hypothetical protein